MAEFGDYIVYVDESGDHAMASPDPSYPVFVLAFCVIQIEKYINAIVPALQKLKFKYFGHDMAVFHEHEIRKARGSFAFLTDATMRASFLQDLNELVVAADFKVLAVCIRKDELKQRVQLESNPYHIALELGLERLQSFLNRVGQAGKRIHVVFEARGKNEDDQLELEFRRVCDAKQYDLTFVLAEKRVNSTGLQLADLVARPIGLSVFRAGQPNKAFSIIEPKLDRSGTGEVKDVGLTCFP